MVIRSMGYTLEIYERQVEKLAKEHEKNKDLRGSEYISGISKNDRIDPVMILVVYFGKRRWDGALELHDLFHKSEQKDGWRQEVGNYRIHLLDVMRFEHMDRFCTDIYQVFDILRRRSSKADMKKFIMENEEAFRHMRSDAYDVIQAYGSFRGLKERKEMCKVEGGYDMCQAWDEMLKDERRKGEIRGEKRGEKRGESRLAKLLISLKNDNLLEEMDRALQSQKYRGKLYRKYGIE